jgi:DNA repair protein RadA/Sms
LGRCPDCQTWNSFTESVIGADAPPPSESQRARDIGAVLDQGPTAITELNADIEPRMACGIGEFDRVCGGGLVPGSVLLIGGDPGVGKSTLVLQVLAKLAGAGRKVLYVTGEESARQVKLRADRLGTLSDNLFVAAMTDVDRILRIMIETRPQVAVVDSIQTMFTSQLSSAPGSVSQVRECAGRISGVAKREGLATLLIGHVTKDGSIAGPRVLEHMVDAVLAFEGERGLSFRVLRALKNRFGSTNEVGVFEMAREGLVEVVNPSRLFLAERPVDEAGSVVTVSMEGTRPLLVEVQALVTPTGYGNPRRTCIGVDPNRVALLAAVLEKKAGLDLIGCDIFVNVAGGVRLSEPAVDLGIACALASSLIDRPIPNQTLVFGEIGLAGEIRSVSQPAQRLVEASKMGFTRAVMPHTGAEGVERPEGIEVVGIRNLQEVIDRLF